MNKKEGLSLHVILLSPLIGVCAVLCGIVANDVRVVASARWRLCVERDGKPIRSNIMPIVSQIIEKWLKENGYDGLWSEECGCEIGALCPCCCSESVLSCEPGYKRPCPKECGDHDFHIGPDKLEQE